MKHPSIAATVAAGALLAAIAAPHAVYIPGQYWKSQDALYRDPDSV